jgi:hypothetical protein
MGVAVHGEIRFQGTQDGVARGAAPPYRISSPAPGTPFVCALFVADAGIDDEERMALSRQLVAAGCRYAVCAGIECSRWDDSIDFAYLETDANFDPPDETFVMTTWHEEASVAEVLEFALLHTNFGGHEFKHLLVLVLGEDAVLLAKIRSALAS